MRQLKHNLQYTLSLNLNLAHFLTEDIKCPSIPNYVDSQTLVQTMRPQTTAPLNKSSPCWNSCLGKLQTTAQSYPVTPLFATRPPFQTFGRQYACILGFSHQGSHFIDLASIQLKPDEHPDERPEALYQPRSQSRNLNRRHLDPKAVNSSSHVHCVSKLADQTLSTSLASAHTHPSETTNK